MILTPAQNFLATIWPLIEILRSLVLLQIRPTLPARVASCHQRACLSAADYGYRDSCMTLNRQTDRQPLHVTKKAATELQFAHDQAPPVTETWRHLGS